MTENIKDSKSGQIDVFTMLVQEAMVDVANVRIKEVHAIHVEGLKVVKKRDEGRPESQKNLEKLYKKGVKALKEKFQALTVSNLAKDIKLIVSGKGVKIGDEEQALIDKKAAVTLALIDDRLSKMGDQINKIMDDKIMAELENKTWQ